MDSPHSYTDDNSSNSSIDELFTFFGPTLYQDETPSTSSANLSSSEENNNNKIHERLYIEFPHADFQVELEVYCGKKKDIPTLLCKVSLRSTRSGKHHALELKSKLQTEFASQFKAKVKRENPNIEDDEIKVPATTLFYLKIGEKLFHLCTKRTNKEKTISYPSLIEFDENKNVTLKHAPNTKGERKGNYTPMAYPLTIIDIIEL